MKGLYFAELTQGDINQLPIAVRTGRIEEPVSQGVWLVTIFDTPNFKRLYSLQQLSQLNMLESERDMHLFLVKHTQPALACTNLQPQDVPIESCVPASTQEAETAEVYPVQERKTPWLKSPSLPSSSRRP